MKLQKNTTQKSGGLFPRKSAALDRKKWAAALKCKKHARHVFIHKPRSLFTAALLCTALLFPQCANVKGIFTEDRSSGPAPDPACTDAPQSSGFNDGDGASEDTPYLICTYAQLGMMSSSLSAHYALGDNIDASASCGGDCSSPSGSGWTPVGGNDCDGMDDDTCFQGTLDGRDYVISNLRVNITENYGGLFGYTGEHAEIRSVGLSGLNVMAGENSGGLVGYNNGSISNSYSTGMVSGGAFVGGLVGNNRGNISSSYSTGTVSAGINTIGGLVGSNRGNISNSYSTGTVSVSENIVGGLAGSNCGNISSSYSTGTASAGNVTASLAGGLVGNTDSTGNISNSYATGTVSSTASSPIFIGGLVGNITGGSTSGINYFADDIGGPDGVGLNGGSCDAAVCVQAMGGDDTARAMWLEDSLNETLDSGLNWDEQLDADGNAVWGNLNAAGFPCLKNMPAGAEACP